MKALQNLKVFTAFSGYDSQCMALDRLVKSHGLSYDLVGWSEIDKYAIEAHNKVYPQWADRNYGDISKVDWNEVPDFNLFTYSFPCTDISAAGEQKGLAKGSGTRSSLLWECERAIETKRPTYLLMENVKALTTQKFLPFFHEWLRLLESYGYTNFSKVLNATDFNIPQNRERIFVVSIKDCEWIYRFPNAVPLQRKLADVLEDDVDEKYYLSDETVQKYLDKTRLNELEGKGFGYSS